MIFAEVAWGGGGVGRPTEGGGSGLSIFWGGDGGIGCVDRTADIRGFVPVVVVPACGEGRGAAWADLACAAGGIFAVDDTPEEGDAGFWSSDLRSSRV